MEIETWPGELVGTWLLTGGRRGRERCTFPPPPDPHSTAYVFDADGSGCCYFGSSGKRFPIRWSVADGKLQIKLASVTTAERFQWVDADTFEKRNQREGWSVFTRQPTPS